MYQSHEIGILVEFKIVQYYAREIYARLGNTYNQWVPRNPAASTRCQNRCCLDGPKTVVSYIAMSKSLRASGRGLKGPRATGPVTFTAPAWLTHRYTSRLVRRNKTWSDSCSFQKSPCRTRSQERTISDGTANGSRLVQLPLTGLRRFPSPSV